MTATNPIGGGPWKGVRATKDPYDDANNTLVDAVNCYIPDPLGGAGLYQRPGMQLQNIYNAFTGNGQAAGTFVDLDTTVFNFVVNHGRIYRVNPALTEFTDVTPTATQYRLWFSEGTGTQPSAGDTVTGDTSSATGAVLRVTVLSGAFEDDDAYGYYTFSTTTGTFQASESLTVSGSSVGTANGPATDSTIVIDPDVTRVYWWSFNNYLIFSDGVNPPWIADDLTNTPITGEYIDFDGTGTSWSAYGQMVDYGGAMIFILNQVAGIPRRSEIVWCAPGDPQTGYEQPNYDFSWILVQQGQGALYAIWGTNVALYYFRDKSIGTVAGVPGPDFESTHTADAIASNVGCLQSATIQQFGTTIFFCDQIGRPQMMPIGSPPQPIWHQLRDIVDKSTSGYPAATAQVACAVIEPTLNLYLAAIWSPDPGIAHAPTQLMAVDANTGIFVGRWIVGYGGAIEALGILNNTYGSGSLVILGTAPGPGGNGVALATEAYDILLTEAGYAIGLLDQYDVRTGMVWAMNAVLGGGDELTTEDGETLTTEDGDPLIVESVSPSYVDDGKLPLVSATTQRFGYTAQHVWNVDPVTVITQSAAPCRVTIRTPNVSNIVEGDPTPSPSSDETYRLVCGCDGMYGRGVEVTVSPLATDAQWILQRVEPTMIPSVAGALDP
jgi:hypothetical protein